MNMGKLFAVIFISLCAAYRGQAAAVIDLAAVLGNSGFEDDLIHSQWTATRPNKNYRLDAPLINPVLVPKGEADPLAAPAGAHFVGIVNPDDRDVSGKLVHAVVAGSFPQGTTFQVTVLANRGRLEGARTPLFDSAPSALRVQFFGWEAGSVPVVNPNTDDWSRRPSVNIRQSFTNWAGRNGEWATQTFQFATDKDLQYISLALIGVNHKHVSYVAFDVVTAGESLFLCLVEGNPGIPNDGVVVSATGGRLDISFEVQLPFSLAGITDGITVSAFPPSTAPESKIIQINFSTAGGECAPGVASGEDVARPVVNGVQGIAIVLSQEFLNDLVDFVREVDPQCAGVTLADLFLKEVIVVDVDSNFVRELDALAVGIGENVFPTETTPPPLCGMAPQ
jgi:hypothetical protein